MSYMFFFFFSSRRRHTRFKCDWSSDVCSSDLSWSRRIGANGSRECAPDDKLHDTHHLGIILMLTAAVDGFRFALPILQGPITSPPPSSRSEGSRAGPARWSASNDR